MSALSSTLSELRREIAKAHSKKEIASALGRPEIAEGTDTLITALENAIILLLTKGNESEIRND